MSLDVTEQKVNVEKKDNQGMLDRKVNQDRMEIEVQEGTRENKE